MKKPKLVTREWLREKLATAKSPSYVIGRALIAIYERQTSEEQSSASTRVRNGVGFTGADAEIGTRCAKAALAGELKPWMVKIWSGVTSTGFPKICKYARQLNEVAEIKQNLKTKRIEWFSNGVPQFTPFHPGDHILANFSY